MNCNICGQTKDTLIFAMSGLYCRRCHQQRIDDKINNFEGDTNYKSVITCPHCGHEFMDSWEFNDSSGRIDCELCDKGFDLEVAVEVTYSTHK